MNATSCGESLLPGRRRATTRTPGSQCQPTSKGDRRDHNPFDARRRPGSLPDAHRRPAARGGSAAGNVVIYCSQDQEHAEAILKDFEQQTGIHVRAEFDIEAAKSVGLTQKIYEERSHPRGDVFWNNEPLNTIFLAHEGAFEATSRPMPPPSRRSSRTLPGCGPASRRARAS
ncbi:MAG: hypothetical protein U1E76_15740 [Planctomycetota bacterium]